MTFGSQNCPMMEASNIKSLRFFVAAPAYTKQGHKTINKLKQIKKLVHDIPRLSLN